METVYNTLHDIGAGNKPIISVFNKIDIYKYDENSEEESAISSQQMLEESIIGKIDTPAIFISAKKGNNIDKLKELIFNEVKKLHSTKYPGTIPFY